MRNFLLIVIAIIAAVCIKLYVNKPSPGGKGGDDSAEKDAGVATKVENAVVPVKLAANPIYDEELFVTGVVYWGNHYRVCFSDGTVMDETTPGWGQGWKAPDSCRFGVWVKGRHFPFKPRVAGEGAQKAEKGVASQSKDAKPFVDVQMGPREPELNNAATNPALRDYSRPGVVIPSRPSTAWSRAREAVREKT